MQLSLHVVATANGRHFGECRLLKAHGWAMLHVGFYSMEQIVAPIVVQEKNFCGFPYILATYIKSGARLQAGLLRAEIYILNLFWVQRQGSGVL